MTTAAVAFSVLDYALQKLYPYHTQFHKNCLITRDDGVCCWHPPPAFGTATPRPSVKKLRQAAAARQATGGSEFRQGKFGTIKSRLPTQNYHPVLSCRVPRTQKLSPRPSHFCKLNQVKEREGERERQRQRQRQTDRQTDRQTETDRQTGRQAGRQADRQRQRDTDIDTETETDAARGREEVWRPFLCF